VPHRHPLVQQTKADACAVMTGNVLDYGDVSVPPAAYASLRPGQWLLDPVLALECQCVHPAPPPPFTVTHRSVLRGQCVCLCTPLLLVAYRASISLSLCACGRFQRGPATPPGTGTDSGAVAARDRTDRAPVGRYAMARRGAG
jgi:hypothetical protein